jgi:phosphatidate cytidylyltransferase
MFRIGRLQPAAVLIIAGTLALVFARFLDDGFENSPWILSLLVLAGMTYHLVAYERGRDQAGTDFGITMAGVLYFGWIGAYLISLRQLPEGLWWVLLALPIVWLADSGAYFVGRRWGRHKLSPRLSPKKTWEGYFGGVVVGVIGGGVLAALIARFAAPIGEALAITPMRGLILGLVLSTITTLGDLGESMIKRQVGVKDSGNLLPGHGGAFDRIDSWLWAGVLAYYVIVYLFRYI